MIASTSLSLSLLSLTTFSTLFVASRKKTSCCSSSFIFPNSVCCRDMDTIDKGITIRKDHPVTVKRGPGGPNRPLLKIVATIHHEQGLTPDDLAGRLDSLLPPSAPLDRSQCFPVTRIRPFVVNEKRPLKGEYFFLSFFIAGTEVESLLPMQVFASGSLPQSLHLLHQSACLLPRRNRSLRDTHSSHFPPLTRTRKTSQRRTTRPSNHHQPRFLFFSLFFPLLVPLSSHFLFSRLR